MQLHDGVAVCYVERSVVQCGRRRQTSKTDRVLRLGPPGRGLLLRFRRATKNTADDLVHGLLSQGHVQGRRRHVAQGRGLTTGVQGRRHKKQRKMR